MISLFVAYVAFPESKDALFSQSTRGSVDIETSGNLGLYYDGKCHKTFGNETIIADEYREWCSNMVKDKKDSSLNPFIQYSIKGKQMKVTKYSVRNGCCRNVCCCDDEADFIDTRCCCKLYSYSLIASNDNRTWKTLHKVEKDNTFYYCAIKTFDIKEAAPYVYYRFVLDEEWPGCPKCMEINQIEFYGDAFDSNHAYSEITDEDESISIIGRVGKRDD